MVMEITYPDGGFLYVNMGTWKYAEEIRRMAKHLGTTPKSIEDRLLRMEVIAYSGFARRLCEAPWEKQVPYVTGDGQVATSKD